MKLHLLWAVLLTTSASTAQADLLMIFRDGAPKDRFTLTNTGACPAAPMDVTIDLSPAPAGLIFDITAQGQGVEVFQPFELTAGNDVVSGKSEVTDGDQTLTLALTGLAPGEGLSFTIDLDDTAGGSKIIVSGAEIAGAQVIVNVAGVTRTGIFDQNGAAVVSLDTCIS